MAAPPVVPQLSCPGAGTPLAAGSHDRVRSDEPARSRADHGILPVAATVSAAEPTYVAELDRIEADFRVARERCDGATGHHGTSASPRRAPCAGSRKPSSRRARGHAEEPVRRADGPRRGRVRRGEGALRRARRAQRELCIDDARAAEARAKDEARGARRESEARERPRAGRLDETVVADCAARRERATRSAEQLALEVELADQHHRDDGERHGEEARPAARRARRRRLPTAPRARAAARPPSAARAASAGSPRPAGSRSRGARRRARSRDRARTRSAAAGIAARIGPTNGTNSSSAGDRRERQRERHVERREPDERSARRRRASRRAGRRAICGACSRHSTARRSPAAGRRPATGGGCRGSTGPGRRRGRCPAPARAAGSRPRPTSHRGAEQLARRLGRVDRAERVEHRAPDCRRPRAIRAASRARPEAGAQLVELARERAARPTRRGARARATIGSTATGSANRRPSGVRRASRSANALSVTRAAGRRTPSSSTSDARHSASAAAAASGDDDDASRRMPDGRSPACSGAGSPRGSAAGL